MNTGYYCNSPTGKQYIYLVCVETSYKDIKDWDTINTGSKSHVTIQRGPEGQRSCVQVWLSKTDRTLGEYSNKLEHSVKINQRCLL